MVRFKNRYVTVQINPDEKTDKPLIIKSNALQQAIQQKVELMYGDFGLSAIKSGFNAKYFNARTRIALIKVRHGPHRFIINSVPVVTEIGGRIASMKIIYVGATMKHCFQFIQKYQRKELEKMWSGLKNDKERKEMEDALMTVTPALPIFLFS